VDWIDGIARLGFPVMASVALAWAFNAFIQRREKEAADREAALIASLVKEREFKDGKLVELIIGYSKDHDDTLEMNSRAKTLLEDLLSRRGSWPEKS